MTTFQIETDDINAIEEIKNFVTQKFHIQVKIIPKTDRTKLKSKTKWAEFAEKMDGLFTPEIVDHIKHSRKEARENFTPNA